MVTQVFGWLLISSSLAGLPASRVGLVLLTQPTFAYVWDVLFFAKPVGMTEAGGAGLALLAIYLGSRSRRAKIKQISLIRSGSTSISMSVKPPSINSPSICTGNDEGEVMCTLRVCT